ncbi:MAG TPA: SpoIID/LytB domain-containing protein, partial [Gemmatimonadales bacterium]|nr:SpoIID/LytB domain-containing protein [Gemmatimonadales bacterium]
MGEIPSAAQAEVLAGEGGLMIRLADGLIRPGAELAVAASTGESLTRLNGRDYRGSFTIRVSEARGGGGGGGGAGVGSRVTAVNVVDLEEYLVGVVGAELGTREGTDHAALQAQAVVSRTIALQRVASSRQRAGDYDLLATVSDQAYTGTGAENELAAGAVSETRGQVLRYQDRVIDAFFHSTCAGRTAAGTEVFGGAERSYLRSIADADGSGRAWCRISPRFRWRETWTGEALAGTLRESLPRTGHSAELAAALRDIRVTERTGTGRVARLELL